MAMPRGLAGPQTKRCLYIPADRNLSIGSISMRSNRVMRVGVQERFAHWGSVTLARCLYADRRKTPNCAPRLAWTGKERPCIVIYERDERAAGDVRSEGMF